MPSGLAYRADEVIRGDQTPAGRFGISKYGGPTTATLRQVTLGTTVSHLVRNNARRVAWRAFNLSSNDARLSFTADVTTATGVPFPASTGVAEADVEYEGEIVMAEVHAIATAASTTVTVIEIIRV